MTEPNLKMPARGRRWPRALALAGALLTGSLAWGAPAPDGHALFERHCAVCHGESGHGGVGVPLALPSFLSSVSDHYLATTIRRGRPGRVMPAFQSLSDAQIRAIVHYIRTWGPGPGPDFSTAKAVKGDPAHGKQLFARHCARCHGADGRGGRGTGVTFSRPRDLPIMPPALNNPGFLAAASDAMIKSTLLHGRQGTPMVAASRMGLSESDVNDLVSYIRSFQGHPPDTARPSVAGESSVLVYDSPYSLKETVEAVKRAAVGHNFRIIRTQNLEYGLMPADQQDPHQVIVYFCDFSFLDKALKVDPRVGLFLPCRVTVVEKPDGKVQVMSINPKRLSHLYNNAELDQYCQHMYRLYRDILEEATL
ncbi:MAG TPA: c-type cytochrome [Gammaproteobacteria bacterium]|nr:c-type cytochrome [Gammaproteobacteria bacterium]